MPGHTTRRGYGWQHQKLRAQWDRQVQTGNIDCWRCGHPIAPGTPWQLGHDDHDRTIYRGPEHAGCNLSAAGRKGAPIAAARRTRRRRQTEQHPGAR